MKRISIVLFVFLGLALNSAFASLILVAPVSLTGTGLGAVNTILTIQNTGTESGCVGWNGTVDVIGNSTCGGGGDAKTGASQTLTRTFSGIGVTSSSDLAVVFNADQPAGGSITLSSLVLTIYAPSGTALWNSGKFSPVFFPQTDKGIGNSGFVFELDPTQAKAAQPFLTGTNRIGLSATATGASGGPETFFVASAKADGFPTPFASDVPEPSSIALIGGGLIALAGLLRRRNA